MNIVNTLTLRHIKTHKKRSILTILAIIVSVAMVTAVFTSALSFVTYFQNVTKAIDGNWHAVFTVEDYKDKISAFNADDSIEAMGASTYYSSYVIDKAALANEDDIDLSINSLTAVDKNYLDIKNVKISHGEMPKNINEVLVSQSFIDDNSLDWSVGDNVTLYLLDDDYNVSEKTVKITAISDSKVTTTDSYGIFAGYDPSDFSKDAQTDVYVRYDKLNNKIWDKISATAASVDAIYEDMPSYNYELFTYSGIMKDNGILVSLGSFCAIILAIIAIVSIFMIYDSFAVSYQERAKYLGMLASVGATKKQKRSSIYFEGLILGAIGIPLGILAGIAGIGITFKAIGNMWLQTIGVEYNKSLELCVNWVVILATVVVSAITIFVSSYIPARKASKTTAIDAIRQADTVKVKKSKRLKTPKLVNKLFGFEGTLAVKNYKRNGRRSRTIVFALFMSVVVFLSVSNFSMMFSDVMAGSYRESYDISLSLAAADMQAANTVVENAKGIDSYYGAAIFYAGVSDGLSDEAKAEDISEYSSTIVFMDNASLDSYLKELGENISKYHDLNNPRAIVQNRCFVEKDSKKKTIAPFNDLTGQKINCQVEHYNSKTDMSEYTNISPTVGISTQKLWSNKMFSYQNTFSPVIILSVDHLSGYVDNLKECTYEFGIKCDDSKQVNEEISNALNEKGISFNSFDASAEMQSINSILIIVEVFVFGFIALITLISIMNIINTISNSMNERRREFAMIRSVGMTPKSFMKMIYFENFRYGFIALAFAIPVSAAIHYGMYKALANSFDYGFQFHPLSYIIAFVAVFVIIAIALLYSFGKIKDNNIIETLKQDY